MISGSGQCYKGSRTTFVGAGDAGGRGKQSGKVFKEVLLGRDPVKRKPANETASGGEENGLWCLEPQVLQERRGHQCEGSTVGEVKMTPQGSEKSGRV